MTLVQWAGMNDFAGVQVAIIDQKGFVFLRWNKADTRNGEFWGVSLERLSIVKWAKVGNPGDCGAIRWSQSVVRIYVAFRLMRKRLVEPIDKFRLLVYSEKHGREENSR